MTASDALVWGVAAVVWIIVIAIIANIALAFIDNKPRYK